MKIHLVRHALALKRGETDKTGKTSRSPRESLPRTDTRSTPPSDELRPLGQVGRRQARALADHFADERPHRLLAGTRNRCRQTLAPLSRASGQPIEIDPRLDDAPASPEGLRELIAELGDTPSVLCTHALPIRELLVSFGIEEASMSSEVPCRKGSVWTLEGPGTSAIERAVYREPAPTQKGRDPFVESRFSRPRSLRAGVLDMGSTSFTLLVAEVNREGTVRPILTEKVMLRLGSANVNHGKLPSELAREAVEAARRMRELAAREKTEAFRAVATASLRDARNGRKVGDKIARAIESPVDILEGKEEARLMFRAFQQRLALGADPVLGLDLGGGSLELAVGCGRHIDHECTLGLGVVRLHSEIVTTDPIRRREVRRIRKRVERELDCCREEIARRQPARLVVAGGTPRAIARLVAAERSGSQPADPLPLELDLEDLRDIGDRLVRSTHEERLEMPGIRRRRADLLATGAVILESVADTLGLDRFTFCDWGLREGVLLDLLEGTGPRRVERI